MKGQRLREHGCMGESVSPDSLHCNKETIILKCGLYMPKRGNMQLYAMSSIITGCPFFICLSFWFYVVFIVNPFLTKRVIF